MGNILKWPSKIWEREMCQEGTQHHRVGAIWYDHLSCTRKTCLKGGKILIDRCPIIRKQKGCTIYFKSPNLRFPDCCDYLICQEIKDSTTNEGYTSPSDHEEPLG
ncbi:uncharacterized protein LOC129001144 [Macrosteles quadrilineatus]|uniref:uncharacterized protein LOC129001144 n=1 Tax=Macrosteles quadrilineatus TaxID=74068 RepID=UPI0023E24AF5|nr:uncharacterized protein LOC129001144 [Macrosteles quadrilineatus]